MYIMASRSRRIYTGVTNDIERRVKEHKAGMIEGFTRKYRINRLVYFERFHYVGNAIGREEEIKSWDRRRRVALIETTNPTWEDLSLEWGKPVRMLHATSGGQQIPRSARDDNFEGASTDGERAEEQQIPRELKLARDDNSDSAALVAAEETLTVKT
ncbi:MAG TPA: GIY-YIG nuclease family protein [Terriglobales bacterium]|nr:GIY-YIG nuclease family protein [Terriglobales bacterium]